MSGFSNNWYVITGGPCAGKSTVLDLLESDGFSVVPEAARVFIDRELALGKALSQIRADEGMFQRKVLEEKIEIENSLPREVVTFFDRGMADSEAYYLLSGTVCDEFLFEAIAKSSYRKVFLFDLLPFEKDHARTESEEEQKRVHELLRESYLKTGVEVVDVPVLPPFERKEFILKCVE